jgi:hypothetical protein
MKLQEMNARMSNRVDETPEVYKWERSTMLTATSRVVETQQRQESDKTDDELSYVTIGDKDDGVIQQAKAVRILGVIENDDSEKGEGVSSQELLHGRYPFDAEGASVIAMNGSHESLSDSLYLRCVFTFFDIYSSWN